MYKLSGEELVLIKKYQHNMDELIDVVKVLCNDTYENGCEDGYNVGFNDGYYFRKNEEGYNE